MSKTEYFPLVNDEGQVIGKATRTECHAGSFLLHPVVHLHVFNQAGDLYLQKRSMSKDIQPGKWDTSVGGHLDYGEDVLTALTREVREELGIVNFEPYFLFKYKFVSYQEAELVHSFYSIYDGEIKADPVEISEGRFWKIQEIKSQIGKRAFTPNFEIEFEKVLTALNK